MQLAEPGNTEEREKKKLKWVNIYYHVIVKCYIIVFFIRKKMKEEARKAELAAADSEDDCSAPKCKRPTGKQVSVRLMMMVNI